MPGYLFVSVTAGTQHYYYSQDRESWLAMYTSVHVERTNENPTPFFDGITAACVELSKPDNFASKALYGDILVSYSSWGIECQFGRRLLRLPDELAALRVTHISMTIPYAMVGIAGTYVRKHADAVVEQHQSNNNGAPTIFYSMTIEGETLGAVNRLLSDIQEGIAKPTRKSNN